MRLDMLWRTNEAGQAKEKSKEVLICPGRLFLLGGQTQRQLHCSSILMRPMMEESAILIVRRPVFPFFGIFPYICDREGSGQVSDCQYSDYYREHQIERGQKSAVKVQVSLWLLLTMGRTG